MNAIAPLIGVVIDPAVLARYVLQQGFDVKDPDKFIMQQPQQAPAPEGAPPGAPPGGAGVPAPGGPPGMGAFAPTGGVPPELVAQLQGQMGLELPAL